MLETLEADQYWSWLLTAVGLLGLWVVGSGKSWGWLINLGTEPLWAIYAITTHQYGFLFSAVAYGYIYFRNYIKSKKQIN
jgi:hypothetical protein